jgi:DNA mismatch endonuclease, patch repair protein
MRWGLAGLAGEREGWRVRKASGRNLWFLEAMVDTRTKDQRRRIMQSVGTKHTGPELKVRRALHALGFRFRLHRKDLPGCPDIVLPKWRTVVFVHGCFWHGHGCAKGQPPKSRPEYWLPKIEANRCRDEQAEKRLKELGWRVLKVWQCQTTNTRTIAEHLESAITGPQLNPAAEETANR